MSGQVPNYIPRNFNKIAIIGEAPGKDEVIEGRPFVGTSGRFLGGLLGSVGVQLQNCYLGNVSQFRPEDNDISKFHWNGDEIQRGLQCLNDDLYRLKPNIVLLLGNVPLKAAKDPATPHALIPKAFENSVSNWRGSLFVPNHIDSPMVGLKCISSYHPAYCLRQYEETPLLRFDLKRTAAEAATPTLVLPERRFLVSISPQEILDHLDRIYRDKPTISIDIEGGIDSMTCISIAESPETAFIVPFSVNNGNFFDSIEDEMAVWRKLALVLEDPTIPKILQNSLYDLFVLRYSYRIQVRGVIHDTMLKHWEAYCELPKGLGFLCSIYTREPYYKFQRTTTSGQDYWTYCCRDSAVTHEISSALDTHLKDKDSLHHYRFNMEMLNPLLYMELRGMRYNIPLAAERRQKLQAKCYALNYDLDLLAKKGVNAETPFSVAFDAVRTYCCKKRESKLAVTPNDLLPTFKKDFEEDKAVLVSMLNNWSSITNEDRGRFNSIVGIGMNIRAESFKDWIYDDLCLPVHYNRKTGARSSDESAMLRIWKKTSHPVARLTLDIARLRTHIQMLGISADGDGRIRCGYNVVGTETGRLTCYTSPTGSGYNLTTIPEEDRDLFLADEDNWMFSFDLSGADTWTVAAHLKALGKPDMMEDLQAGLKPAKILALMLRHGTSISHLSREELKIRSEEVKKTDWDYFACKIGIHGTNYLMGVDLLSGQIYDESDGQLNFSRTEIRALQNCVFHRYHVKTWHDHTQICISSRPALRSSSGHLRHFFGRKDEILGKALAHEPQNNTTYVTNLAIMKLWKDPENRRPNGSLLIEPLHQVHDSLVGQFPKSVLDWARPKIKDYFTIYITIAGQRILIPVEGGYGPSWGETKNAF